MSSHKWLIRLYDMTTDESPLSGKKYLEYDVNGSISRSPVPIELKERRSVVATGVLNIDGLATFHVTQGNPEGVKCLVSEVVKLYAHAGYAYLELTGDGDCKEILESMDYIEIPTNKPQEIVDDIPDMPWADIYFDLRAWTEEPINAVMSKDFVTRLPESSERLRITRWLENNFGVGWASEFDTSFRENPPTSMIAIKVIGDDKNPMREPVGFICFDVVRRGMASTFGVISGVAGRYPLVARSLMMACFQAMKERGYTYAIFSGMSRRVGALRAAPGSWTIPGSYPGVFGNGVNLP